MVIARNFNFVAMGAIFFGRYVIFFAIDADSLRKKLNFFAIGTIFFAIRTIFLDGFFVLFAIDPVPLGKKFRSFAKDLKFLLKKI